ncbi:TerB family tellurite resistance protein [Gammaproteobacteria bacterium]|jgi:uncharacterized tellurite resistance protein B-like protein|nr:TerB family tellurite resistance protein [Gammaproteobacteria bacterium]
MLKAISSFFEANFAHSQEENETSTAHRLQLASAALMIELCKSDQSIDETETSALVEILKTRFELEQSQLTELMQLAEQEARDSTSLYQFTSLMNENFEYSEKVSMIGNMWEVAFADGKIDRYEEHLIRKVADLLYLSHIDFIKSKKIARDKYAS